MVVINETVAKKFWPNESPLGKQIRLDYMPDEPLREIVGVVRHTRMSLQQRQFSPCIDVPYLQQTPRWMAPVITARECSSSCALRASRWRWQKACAMQWRRSSISVGQTFSSTFDLALGWYGTESFPYRNDRGLGLCWIPM